MQPTITVDMQTDRRIRALDWEALAIGLGQLALVENAVA